jgi:IS5 family transposase
MLRERYARRNLFEEIEGISLNMEPVLTQLDKLLEDDRVFRTVKGDLGRRYPRTLVTGRGSTPVEVVLRMLVVKHLYGWSYEQTEQWVNDSLVLRQFCRVYLEKVPDDTTLIRWANLIQPTTLQGLLEHVVELARQLKVTKGRKLRIDGTVVETNIHHPTDSTLLQDGVRVLSRLVARAGRVLHGRASRGKGWIRQQTQTAREAWLSIVHAAQRRGEEAEASMKQAYRTLLSVSQALLEQAQQVKDTLQLISQPAAQRLLNQLAASIPRVHQVMRQTHRRVLNGESVPARDKLVSLFEPHTAIIRKGKFGKDVEFGRVIWLDEVDGGIVSRYAILSGNPPDADQLQPSLDHHRARFGQSPHLLTADRKVFSPKGEAYATQYGVKYVAIPKPGARSPARQAHEAQPWFRSGRNWRAGLESRISLLKRRFGLDRCRYHGDDGMQRWVGWGVIAYDLWAIARQVACYG